MPKYADHSNSNLKSFLSTHFPFVLSGANRNHIFTRKDALTLQQIEKLLKEGFELRKESTDFVWLQKDDLAEMRNQLPFQYISDVDVAQLDWSRHYAKLRVPDEMRKAKCRNSKFYEETQRFLDSEYAVWREAGRSRKRADESTATPPKPSSAYLHRLFNMRLMHADKGRGKTFLLQIINNQLYISAAKNVLSDPHSKMCLQNILPLFKSVMRHFDLPDMEMVISLLASDWWFDSHQLVVSYAKHLGSSHVLIPRFYFNHHGRWNKMDSYRQDTWRSIAWRHKKHKGLFRGALTHWDRQRLTELGKEYKELLDAGITSIIPEHLKEFPELLFSNRELKTTSSVNREASRYYRYIVHLLGAGCADRLWTELLSNSAVVMAGVDQYEYWYHWLHNFEHLLYAPGGVDQVPQLIAMANEEPELGAIVGEASTRLVQELLEPHEILCFMYETLVRYARLFEDGKVVRHVNSVKVPEDVE